MDDVYPDFEQHEMTFLGATKTVFRKGEGPAVIVMHEVPGLYPAVAVRKLALCGNWRC